MFHYNQMVIPAQISFISLEALLALIDCSDSSKVYMCGRFAQSMSRDDYLAFLTDEQATNSIPRDPEPIGRYNVAPGTKILLLNQQDDELHLDPVHWGYDPVGGISPHSSTPGEKRRRNPCSSIFGKTVARYALPMAGLNGKGQGKGIRSRGAAGAV